MFYLFREEKSNLKSSIRTAEKKSIKWHETVPNKPVLSPTDEKFQKLYESDETEDQFYERIFEDWELQDEINQFQKASYISSLLLGPIIFGLRLTTTLIRLFFLILNATTLGKIQVISSSLETITKFDEIPMVQRKQAAVVFFFLILAPLVSVAFSFTLFLLIFPLTTLPTLAYLIYIYFDDAPDTGKRVAFLRYWKIWTYFVEYFPIRLVKTENLDPSEKYLFCYHPHGIISFGAFGNFATDATGFSRLFPGISLRLATLSLNFTVPFLREYLLSMGVCSCSRKACSQVLQRGPGSSLMIVIGGADESLLAEPGTYRLNVNGRKGFVRVAIDNGANLVPVLGFGENDVFTTQVFKKGSTGYKFQSEFKKRFGFATPIFWGRDVSNENSFGFLPHRTPIICVVGKPIKCPKIPDHLKGDKLRTTAEGREIVNKYHAEYLSALKALYNAFKDKWASNRCESMMLVGRTASKINKIRR